MDGGGLTGSVLRVRAPTIGGACVAHPIEPSHARETWIVRGGAVGEVVRAVEVGRRKSVVQGEVVEVLTPHAGRVAPPCPWADRCGGCSLQHLDRATQLDHLRTAVDRQFHGLGVHMSVLVPSDAGLGTRRRARLHYGRGPDGFSLGLFRPRTHEIVDVSSCAILDAPLDAAVQRVRALAPWLGDSGEIVGLSDGRRAVLGLPGVRPTPQVVAAAENLLDARLVGIALRGGRTRVGVGQVHLDVDAITLDDGTALEPLRLSPFDFAQAHERVNAQLVRDVTALVAGGDPTILELYGGHGNFTRALSHRARHVVAVESDRAAVRNARRWFEAHGSPAQTDIVLADVERWLGRGRADGLRPDVVLVDPPRSGMGMEVAAKVAALGAGKIVYVSCDPATLLRDLSVILPIGYALAELRGYELMPLSGTLELVAVLRRTRSSVSARDGLWPSTGRGQVR